MQIRNETIKKISMFLKEDATDQFSIQEIGAVLEGDSCFYVENTDGDKVKVEIIYSEQADVLDYKITSFKMFLEGN